MKVEEIVQEVQEGNLEICANKDRIEVYQGTDVVTISPKVVDKFISACVKANLDLKAQDES